MTSNKPLPLPPPDLPVDAGRPARLARAVAAGLGSVPAEVRVRPGPMPRRRTWAPAPVRLGDLLSSQDLAGDALAAAERAGFDPSAPPALGPGRNCRHFCAAVARELGAVDAPLEPWRLP